MTDKKIDFYKPWRIGDLPEKVMSRYKAFHEDFFEFDPAATYVGEIDDGVGIFEVPHCTYCGTGFYKTYRCKHVVCVYDSNISKYIEIDPDFKRYVLNIIDNLAHEKVEPESESMEEVHSDIQGGQFPRMYLLVDIIKGFSFHATSGEWEGQYLVCGYADDRLLLECIEIVTP